MWWDKEELPDAGQWWRRENMYFGRDTPITAESWDDAEPRRVDIDDKGLPRYSTPHHPAPLDFWLVLLPNRTLTNLQPVLWQAGGDYNWQHVYVEPLTGVRGVQRLRSIRWLEKEGATLFDALKELLLTKDENGESQLQAFWTRTAANLRHCPFLALQKQHVALVASLQRSRKD